VLHNLIALFAATKGKNTIISSGARNPLYHRMPFEVISLLCSLGIRKDYAFAAVSTNPAACLARARFIRMFKGTVQQATGPDLVLFN
jgi:RNase P/RNase MRP subunit p30